MAGEVVVAGMSCEVFGSGEPLVLMHGTGSSRDAWRPVVEPLSAHHELILVDLPSHGDSQPPPAAVTPNPIGYAPLLEELLDALGFEQVHAAGFSIGGWASLELAKRGRACSVTAFGPAGLWKPRSPRPSEASLWLSRRAARVFAPFVPYAFRSRIGRTLFLNQQFGRPWLLSPDEATEAARTLASTKEFDAHLRATNRARFSGGHGIDVPVTIAFGSRERLLFGRRGRRRDELPPQTRWVGLPGCGHIPTWDDPGLVTRVILETTAAAAAAA
jgi:pimeloyl-ACP methyl ester carboxylesterase